MSNLKRIVSVVGTRPHFVKLAPISWAINNNNVKLEHIIIHTGQHFSSNMSELFFDELEIQGDLIFASDTRGIHSFADIQTNTIEKLSKLRPSCVLVYGDTLSTFAGAVGAISHQYKLAHIEAGLRCNGEDLIEETIRRVVDHGSDYLFPPNEIALKNLESEQLMEKSYLLGNLAEETFVKMLDKLKNLSTPKEDAFIICTLHRQANVDDKNRLVFILKKLSESKLPIKMLLHPRLKKRMDEFGLRFASSIELIEPLGYLRFLSLLKGASGLITDSGGLQWEANWLQIPFLLVRKDTERPETLNGIDSFLDFQLEKLEDWVASVTRNTQAPSDKAPPHFGLEIIRKIEELVNV